MATAPFLPLPLDDDDDEEEDGAAAAPVALPVAEPLALEPELELEPLAAAWNALKVLFAFGLMAKTMPIPQ